jgi:hypothetical protein
MASTILCEAVDPFIEKVAGVTVNMNPRDSGAQLKVVPRSTSLKHQGMIATSAVDTANHIDRIGTVILQTNGSIGLRA